MGLVNWRLPVLPDSCGLSNSLRLSEWQRLRLGDEALRALERELSTRPKRLRSLKRPAACGSFGRHVAQAGARAASTAFATLISQHTEPLLSSSFSERTSGGPVCRRGSCYGQGVESVRDRTSPCIRTANVKEREHEECEGKNRTAFWTEKGRWAPKQALSRDKDRCRHRGGNRDPAGRRLGKQTADDPHLQRFIYTASAGLGTSNAFGKCSGRAKRSWQGSWGLMSTQCDRGSRASSSLSRLLAVSSQRSSPTLRTGDSGSAKELLRANLGIGPKIDRESRAVGMPTGVEERSSRSV